jgi:hypothetical protein
MYYLDRFDYVMDSSMYDVLYSNLVFYVMGGEYE